MELDALLLSRVQFAFTIAFHIIFPSFTIGLASFLAVLEGLWLATGKLLDLMLAAIGIDRGGAYIANIIPWRPPGNRTPTPQETQICLPFTLRQIELANPDILVCLGGPSSQTLLGVKEGIKRTRGRWFTFHTGTREIRAIATFHPAYLLRSPLEKRFAWRDLLAIRKALDSTSP